MHVAGNLRRNPYGDQSAGVRVLCPNFPDTMINVLSGDYGVLTGASSTVWAVGEAFTAEDAEVAEGPVQWGSRE